jgi:hypothetical protein
MSGSASFQSVGIEALKGQGLEDEVTTIENATRLRRLDEGPRPRTNDRLRRVAALAANKQLIVPCLLYFRTAKRPVVSH